MLTKDQRERLSLLKTLIGEEIEVTRAEALDALEKNFWDTTMAAQWIKQTKKDPNASLEEFQKGYDEARKKVVALPQDRYDVPNTKSQPAVTNRAQRRAEKKKAKKKSK